MLKLLHGADQTRNPVTQSPDIIGGLMAMERLETLEARVRKLVEMVQLLKRENAELQSQLRTAKEQLMRQQHYGQRWEEERDDIRARIEKVMGELELLEGIGESKEVALE